MSVEPFIADELSPVDVRETSIDRQLSAALDALAISRDSPAAEDPDLVGLPALPPSPEKARTSSSPPVSSHPNARVALFPAPACTLHTYIRTSNSSTIVERPQRLRAVAIGLACGVARLEEAFTGTAPPVAGPSSAPDFVQLVSPTTYNHIDIRTHEATKYVHEVLADLEEERTPESEEKTYIARLHDLVTSCLDKISAKQSEIPEGWPQGDLYLSPGSMAAFQSSIATVCAAVDLVASPTPGPRRAFASVRPPGHHCSSATPSGFCFLNNVAIAAVHAHMHHGITHVAILDIDLHHGNGTQAIAWAINAETNKRAEAAAEEEAPQDTKPGLQVYYGSVHDILSYPCETGDLALTQAASICIHGAHGQHIENIHLEPYTSDADFWGRLYPQKYSQLLQKADEFFARTGAVPEKSLIFISCGFDACSHELVSMSRHKRNVPPTFYGRFAADTQVLAERRTKGKTISVLEGGYGDRALESGAMAYLVGMFLTPEEVMQREAWWSVEELIKIEKTFPPPKGAARKAPLSSVLTAGAPHLARALALLPLVFPPLSPEEQPLPSSAPVTPAQPHRMGLRDRKTLKPAIVDSTPPRTESRAKAPRGKRGGKSTANTPTRLPPPDGQDGPPPLTTPPTEAVPPLPVTPLERLTSSMQELHVKPEPETTPTPPKLPLPVETSPTPPSSQTSASDSLDPSPTSSSSLKFKVRVPPNILNQLRAQAAPNVVPGPGPTGKTEG